MTTIAGHELDSSRSRMSGRVITAADEDYDQARSVWNGAIDTRPAVIAHCGGPGDIAAAIGFAQDVGLEISVRCGAHNFGGAAVGDDGLTIDLSAMCQVLVDPAARVTRCGGGAMLAQLDVATQEHGLAITGGTVSHIGVGGLTLGGGFGWLTPSSVRRRHRVHVPQQASRHRPAGSQAWTSRGADRAGPAPSTIPGTPTRH